MLQQSIRGIAKPKTALQSEIDVFGRRDAFPDDIGGFAHQRHLKPVAQLSRPVLLNHHWRSSAGCQQVANSQRDFVISMLGFDNLYEWNQVRRIPEMRGKNSAPILRLFRDGGNAQS